MPIWGLKTVAQVIATGFEGPQHCDEPWPYQFMVCSSLSYLEIRCLILHSQPGQQVLVHVRGEGRNSVWVPGRIVKPTYTKQYPVCPPKS